MREYRLRTKKTMSVGYNVIPIHSDTCGEKWCRAKSERAKAELQTMIHNIEDRNPVRPVQPNVPWYNPEMHTTGDTVRMMVGNIVKVVTL